MITTTIPASITLFHMRYRYNNDTTPNQWRDVDARTLIAPDIRSIAPKQVQFPGMPEGVALYESAKFVAAACVDAKKYYDTNYSNNKLIFDVNKVVISDPEQVAFLTTYHNAE